MLVARVMMMFCVLLTGLTWSGAFIPGLLTPGTPGIEAMDSRPAPLLPVYVDPNGLPIAGDSSESRTVGTGPDRRAGLIGRDDDRSIPMIASGLLNNAPHDDALVRSRQARLIRGPPSC